MATVKKPEFTVSYPINCKMCDKSFVRKKQYMRHLENHKNKPLFCCFCLSQMCCKEHLDKHMRNHSATKSYVCQFCQKTCSSLQMLKDHVRGHTGNTPIICEFCVEEFQKKLENSVEDYLPLKSKGLAKIMFYSPQIFKNPEELKIHFQARHYNVSNKDAEHYSDPESRKDFKCFRCDTYFVSSFDLQVHYEENILKQNDGNIGCAMYELFRLCLGKHTLLNSDLKRKTLTDILTEFLTSSPYNENSNNLSSLNLNDLVKLFCKKMLIRHYDDEDSLLTKSVEVLILDMIFILREICIET